MLTFAHCKDMQLKRKNNSNRYNNLRMKLVKPKKFLGQHFLKDLQVAQDLCRHG